MENKKVQSYGEAQKEAMLKKARKFDIKFGINDGTRDGDYEVISCYKRFLEKGKKERLVFKQYSTPSIFWPILITILGTVIPGFMFYENDITMKLIAGAIFLISQIGSIAIVNAGFPEIRIFDKIKGKYWHQRPNHLFTKLFRKTRVNFVDLGKVTGVKSSSFEAKRWTMKWIGSGENKFRQQTLIKYENYRLLLIMSHSEPIPFYDWYEMDYIMEIGEEVANFLNVPFKLE